MKALLGIIALAFIMSRRTPSSGGSSIPSFQGGPTHGIPSGVGGTAFKPSGSLSGTWEDYIIGSEHALLESNLGITHNFITNPTTFGGGGFSGGGGMPQTTEFDDWVKGIELGYHKG